LFLLAFTLLIRKQTPATLFLFWVFCCQSLYSIYLGGDVWEWLGGSNRYIAIVMPCFFLLFSTALHTLLSKFLSEDQQSSRKVLIAFSTIASLFLLNNVGLENGLKRFLFLEKQFYVKENKHLIEEALYLRSITTPNAKIAIVWAGVLPYFTDRYMIDLIGKNDKHIAHRPAHIIQNADTIPGHLKWDYDFSIGKLKPDVVSQLWMADDAAKILAPNYIPFRHNNFIHYVRKNSTDVLIPVYSN
jgi:hypothetical protein